MAERTPALHRSIVVVDVAGFTDRARTVTHQTAVQRGLYDVLTEAFSDAGVALDTCRVEDRGDGAMILLPPEIPKSVLAVRLPPGLMGALRRYNAVHSTEANVQLRVALHAGEVSHNGRGVVSQAVNFAFRILDAEEAKLALKRTGGMLALIASDPFYQDVIAQDPAADPGSYRSIPVAVKNVSTTAWLRLPDTVPSVQRVPGVPKVWGQVPPRNPLFTGRDKLLDQLSGRLAARGATVILPAAALHGMGGIGKTQLAAEYVYRRMHLYDIVWWIQATQRAQILTSLTQLAQQLDLPGSAEADTAVPAVLESLRLGQPYRRWLLIFDAADSPEVVRPYLPTSGPGETLITSRNPHWADVAKPLEVAVFTRDETAELLCRRGLEADDHEVDQLAEKLGDLPLAVDQAAAWQVETGTPVDEYLRLFDEKVTELLDSTPTDYTISVGAAWNVSFDELETRNPTAYQLLQVCAFFAPEPITRRLFTTWLDDPIQVSRAIRDINRYGLAKVDHRRGTILLHRLVQLMLRRRIDTIKMKDLRHAAHVVLANYDPKDPMSPTQRQRYHDILPHVYASGLAQCDDSQVRKLVINLVKFLYFGSGDLEEGARLAKHAFERWTARFDENSEDIIWARLIIAMSLKFQGEFSSARNVCEEIYRGSKGVLGEDHILALQTCYDLAGTLRLCGDYRRALELTERVYRGRAELLGEDDIATLNALTVLIIDRRESGHYREARREHELLVDRVRKIIGKDLFDMLRHLDYLAVTRRKDGDLAGALELSAQVLEQYRQNYGDAHPNRMICALGYSIDLRYAHDLDLASQCGDTVLNQIRGKFGDRHPYTLSAAADLAITLRLHGDVENARRHNENSLEQFRVTLGTDHPHAIACAINLASDLAAAGHRQAALAMGTDALERARRMLGADHPTTLAASLNACLDSGADLTDILAKYRRVLGEDHPKTRAAEAGIRDDCDIDPLPL